MAHAISTVLVVDDQQDARDMLAEYLNFCGFTVHTARDGVEAVTVAAREHPRVILMDLMMPRMDGWEATRRLKADARTKDCAVIVVSAHAERSARQRAQQAGCDDFIAKPCDLDQLAERVRIMFNSPAPTRSNGHRYKRTRRLEGAGFSETN